MNGNYTDKPSYGCALTAIILLVVLVGVVLFCGLRSDQIKEEHNRFREKCRAEGGVTYYQDLENNVGKLVCVKGGTERVVEDR
jgi:hypothetical protein